MRCSIRLICCLTSASVVAVTMAACGDDHSVARTTTTVRPTILAGPRSEPRGWRDADSSALVVEATQLVVEDAVWNRVVIHADGRGNVARWTGETTPIHYFVFRLPGSELARVRRLVARVATRTVQSQTFPIAQNALVYTIRADGRSVRALDAPGRTGLGPLVAIFDRLISRYS
jgi:hypothetical protein